MACHWLRRALLVLAPASALFLAACGSGTIESQFTPTRVVAFGDGMSDMGQTSNDAVTNARYTVNDKSVNIWVQQLAFDYGLLTNFIPQVSGGTAYATGNARIAVRPDAAGNASTPTVTQQIDMFLATGSLAANDLPVVSGGTADIIAEMAKVRAGTETSDQMIANVKTAGAALGGQVRRLVQAGAPHVLVVGVYDLSKSPWGIAINQTTLLNQASTQFNDQLLLSIVDLGANVLYVDAALFFNLMVSSPGSYGLTDATTVVCTSLDTGPGIGIGTDVSQINSARCTSSTIYNALNFGLYAWADFVYPTPTIHRQFGDYVYNRIRARW
jgi:outer membrane lipase/esterase